MTDKLTSHDAHIVLLDLEIRGLQRLVFDAPDISDADNELLTQARDKRIETLKQNLIYAKKISQ